MQYSLETVEEVLSLLVLLKNLHRLPLIAIWRFNEFLSQNFKP